MKQAQAAARASAWPPAVRGGRSGSAEQGGRGEVFHRRCCALVAHALVFLRQGGCAACPHNACCGGNWTKVFSGEGERPDCERQLLRKTRSCSPSFSKGKVLECQSGRSGARAGADCKHLTVIVNGAGGLGQVYLDARRGVLPRRLGRGTRFIKFKQKTSLRDSPLLGVVGRRCRSAWSRRHGRQLRRRAARRGARRAVALPFVKAKLYNIIDHRVLLRLSRVKVRAVCVCE